jgi:hypothetical protein
MSMALCNSDYYTWLGLTSYLRIIRARSRIPAFAFAFIIALRSAGQISVDHLLSLE